MQNNKFINYINQPINQILGAVVILLVAISLGIYLYINTDVEEVTITPGVFIIPVLFIVLVVGFVLMVFNKTGAKVTSKTTDKKVGKIIGNIYLYILAIFILYLLWGFYKLA